MRQTIRIPLTFLAITLFSSAATAQRRIDPLAEQRHRTIGGEAAVTRYRRQVASTADTFTPAELARALSHRESQARNKARAELKKLVREGVDITDAIPELRQAAFGQTRITDRLEAHSMRTDALDMLVVADRDITAKDLAKRLAESGPFQDPLALRMLAGIDEISVDIDEYLFPMFAQTMASSNRQQRDQKYVEGQVAWAVAKLAVDREAASKSISKRMRWPMDQGYYVPEHFLAVRRCAAHCGPLVPGLKQAMYSESKSIQYDAMILISALAVYHDDAWEAFSNRLQDRFVDMNSKQYMATSFAHTWVLAAEQTRSITMSKIEELNNTVPEWQTWRSASQSVVSPLHSDFDSRKADSDVKAKLRELTGFTPAVQRPFAPRDR